MKGIRIQSLVAALVSVLTAVSLMIPTVASAAESMTSGTFFELSMGSARDANELANDIDVGHTNYVKRAYLGYRFNEYFGFQVGYVDFSTIRYKYVSTGLSDEFDYDGIHGKVFFYLPFKRDSDGYYAIGVSGGSWSWNSDIRSTYGNSKSRDVAPVVGAALLFSGKTSALKLEYEMFRVEPLVTGPVFSKSGKQTLDYGVASFSFLFYM